MILHIVRSGETIKMIADNYQCEISDITSNNLHITDFKNLKPGMKLKIPFLTKPIMEVLEETESFISDYYPTLNTDFKETKNKDEVKQEESITLDVVVKEENITDESERGEELRKRLIYQDFINRGYSKERATREKRKRQDLSDV